MKKQKKSFILCITVLLAALFVSNNLYQLTLIQGDSMCPTYKNMQFTLIDKRAEHFQCGDVIAFYCPALDCIMVKRIIASPGQTIQISDGIVIVDGKKSPYIQGNVSFAGIASNAFSLDDNQFFVMGDNYAQSKDSRYAEIGCINREMITGRLFPNRPVITTAKPHP